MLPHRHRVQNDEKQNANEKKAMELEPFGQQIYVYFSFGLYDNIVSV